ncbi:hypothetical protein FBU59_002570, partial [Linderina macrospora]
MADYIDTQTQREAEEHEPLLQQAQTESYTAEDGSSEFDEEPLLTRRQKLHSAARYAKHFLGICLAIASAMFGMYILYIIVHIPHMYRMLRNIDPKLVDATLIDIADDAVLFAATLDFSGLEQQQEFTLPMINVMIRHEGKDVGWVLVEDILV